MQPDQAVSSRHLHHGIVLLALTAAAAFTIADADGESPVPIVVFRICLQAVLTFVAMRWFRRLQRRLGEPPLVLPVLLAVFLVSIVWEPLSRWCWGTGRPLEIMMMLSLRNLMLALAAAGCWMRHGVWALIASLFVVIFSAAITTSHAVQALVAIYAIGGIIWLAANYWDSLRDHLLVSESQNSRPRRWLIAGSMTGSLLLVLAGAGDNSVASSLRGWLPSSGGDGGGDPFARNGVGDGEALVAGTDDIRSFGPIDDAPFLQDDRPSLYDVFDDRYDEPVPPPQDQDRAVALPPEFASRIDRHLHTRTEKAAREFSTLRRSSRSKSRPVDDIRSDALFYVAGRTPLHLRLETYDLFDGVNWHPTPDAGDFPPVEIVDRKGRPWVNLGAPSHAFDCFRGPDCHAIKVVALETNRIPAPLHLTGVHIDQVSRADMFAWAQESILRLDRKALPALVPIHLTSAVVDRDLVAGTVVPPVGIGLPACRALPQIPAMERVKDLAASWVEGVPLGWPQVIAIERRLREAYDHDPTATAPENCSVPVEHFLFESRLGPDYQFATAAALLLRSLGYATRVVSGFYAHPEKYDQRSRHTPVYSDDVHFWTEVYLGVGTWATIEPTPGYEVLAPPPGILEQVVAQIAAAVNWARRNVLLLAVMSVSTIAVVRRRRDLIDAYLTARWRWRARRDTSWLVLETLSLIEWRMASCGLGRPQGVTLRQWIESAAGELQPTLQPVAQLIPHAESAAFAATSLPVPTDEGVTLLCRKVVSQCRRRSILSARATRPTAWGWTVLQESGRRRWATRCDLQPQRS